MKNKILPVRLGQHFSSPTHRAALSYDPTDEEGRKQSPGLMEEEDTIARCQLKMFKPMLQGQGNKCPGLKSKIVPVQNKLTKKKVRNEKKGKRGEIIN